MARTSASSATPKIVYVKWDDSSAHLDTAWMKRDEVPDWHGDLTCETVGYAIHECDKYLTIAHSLTPHEAGGVLCIPKETIRKRKRLRRK